MIDDYFQHLNETLQQAGVGRPAILLDLDRLDHNISLVNQQFLQGDPACRFRLRLVVKSLPSAELLDYIYKQTSSTAMMVFHQPYIPWALHAFPDADILLGKPMLRAAAAESIGRIDQGSLQRIQWLVDTEATIDAYESLAHATGLQLRVNVEIDVGLGRGGADSPDTLRKMLLKLKSSRLLRFSGLMGYDAHIPYLKAPIATAFVSVIQRYGEFYSAAREVFPDADSLSLNSGGSQTWPLYAQFDAGPVNDISIGSAFVKPARFSRLEDHQPALFIASPTLKQFPRWRLSKRSPHLDTTSVIYGGGWPAAILWPNGLQASAVDDAPNENLMPNQSQYFKPHQLKHGVGDFVFFHPYQSDAMFQFEDILVLRDKKIVDCWHPIPGRY